jgi:hypothetical protein
MAFELIPLNPAQHTLTFVPKLSTELPFFNLTARKKDIPKVIKYQGNDAAGRPINWEVYQDTSKEIGAPAVKAHEVWYLLVKPSIDSQRLPNGTIPEIIPLGGIRSCLRKVGWTIGGYQGHELIKALTQISFAGCVADLWLPTGEHDQEGKERFLQIKGRFSRMSVYAIGEHHLTEEELAQKKFEFDLEDVLYIRLDPLEAKLQQLQDHRIFDNQYLFSVNPAARRWYELMAAKIFGVVKNNGQFCEIRYSWYIKHHHTLKRQYERFRVVEQMKRVVNDHMESGYLNKVEYRAIKEPDQEIDYIIRYYPGPGASESTGRIQTYIRQRKGRTKLLSAMAAAKEGSGVVIEPQQQQALSVITAQHHDLMKRLSFEFGIGLNKAYVLTVTKKEAVILQLDAWRFRGIKPRNAAGWMIQAIENNYEVPGSYFEDKKKQEESEKFQAAQTARQACTICQGSGFRRVISAQYPSGAMRQCTHDATIEGRYDAARSDLSSSPTTTSPNARKEA